MASLFLDAANGLFGHSNTSEFSWLLLAIEKPRNDMKCFGGVGGKDNEERLFQKLFFRKMKQIHDSTFMIYRRFCNYSTVLSD